MSIDLIEGNRDMKSSRNSNSLPLIVANLFLDAPCAQILDHMKSSINECAVQAQRRVLAQVVLGIHMLLGKEV